MDEVEESESQSESDFEQSANNDLSVMDSNKKLIGPETVRDLTLSDQKVEQANQ